MKRLFKIIAALGAALTFVAAHAQLSVQTTSLNGGTANVAASTTNSVTVPIITVAKANNAAIQASFKLAGSGTSAVVFTFDESVDASVWKSASTTLSVTANGTNSVNNILKLATEGSGYYRLSSVANPNASAITNLVLKYSYKAGL